MEGKHIFYLLACSPQTGNIYRLSFCCQQASEKDVFETVPAIVDLFPQNTCAQKSVIGNTHHGSEAGWERALLVSLYPDMLLCVFFWLRYTNNSRGPGLGNRFTWGICLGSTWKGIISRVSRNEKGKQWPGLGDSVYNLIILKMKLSVQPRGDGFFSSGHGRGWLLFLALPDTVANQVYLFCEFSATQVSSTFLWFLGVGFSLTAHVCLCMCEITFMASYAFMTVGEHVSGFLWKIKELCFYYYLFLF